VWPGQIRLCHVNSFFGLVVRAHRQSWRVGLDGNHLQSRPALSGGDTRGARRCAISQTGRGATGRAI